MIAVFALVLCTAQPPSQQHSVHAPNSTLFVECPDVGAALDAYEHSPVSRMLRDEAVQDALAKLSKALDVDVAALLESTLKEYGASASAPGHPVDTLVALLRKARSFSVSYGMGESQPGETQRTIQALTIAIDELDQIAERIEKQLGAGAAPTSLAELALPEALAADPWGRPYVYSATKNGFELCSLGRDGERGGEGEDADIAYDANIVRLISAELARRTGGCAAIEFVSSESASEVLAQLTRSFELSDAPAPAPWTVKTITTSLGPISSGWVAQSGSSLLIGTGGTTVQQVHARIAGDSPSLATASVWGEFDHLAGPSRGATIVRGFSDTRSQTAALSGPGASPLSALEEIGSMFGLDDARIAWRMQLVGERFSNDIVSFQTSKDSLLSLIGKEAVSRETLAYTPSDAIGFFALHIDSEEVRKQVAGALSDDDGRDSAAKLAEIEAKYDFKLDEDICANLRGGAAGYLLPLTAIGLPNMGLVASLRDPAKFERGLRGVFNALADKDGPGLNVRTSKYRDAPMWTISFDTGGGNAQLAAFSPTPTFSIVKDRLIVSLTSLRAKKDIKRALGEDDAPNTVATKEGIFPADAGFVGWMDWAAMIDGLYGTARSAAAMFGGQIDLPLDLPALMTALPESSRVFTRFYEPTTLTMRPVDGSYVMRWETSFGPETWLGMAGLGFGVQGMVAGDSSGEESVVEGDVNPEVLAASEAQRDFALDALRALSSRITIFHLDQGRYPSSLEELAQPTTNYPRGFLEGIDVSLDPWGAAYRYAPSADGGAYRLWSLGPDGADANGEGDDIPAP